MVCANYTGWTISPEGKQNPQPSSFGTDQASHKVLRSQCLQRFRQQERRCAKEADNHQVEPMVPLPLHLVPFCIGAQATESLFLEVWTETTTRFASRPLNLMDSGPFQWHDPSQSMNPGSTLQRFNWADRRLSLRARYCRLFLRHRGTNG
jgi:hypothetical protein